uniref:Uncharacterized protein n=1 Tax=Gouania willdenowi TaxID=441366 RepID=A0A8C5GRQ0_GOUWI
MGTQPSLTLSTFIIYLYLLDLIKQDNNLLRSNSILKGKNYNNVSLAQRQTINRLRKNNEIIIKPADKGGQIVIQDHFHYLLEAERQLQNRKYYIPLQNPLQPVTSIKIKEIVDSLYTNKYITAEQKYYLYGPDSLRPRCFYLLPKIHKDPDSRTVPHKVPMGRPIVSDCGSESYQIGQTPKTFPPAKKTQGHLFYFL